MLVMQTWYHGTCKPCSFRFVSPSYKVAPSSRQGVYKVHCLCPMFEDHLQVTLCLLMTSSQCQLVHLCISCKVQVTHAYLQSPSDTCLQHTCLYKSGKQCQRFASCSRQHRGRNQVARVLILITCASHAAQSYTCLLAGEDIGGRRHQFSHVRGNSSETCLRLVNLSNAMKCSQQSIHVLHHMHEAKVFPLQACQMHCSILSCVTHSVMLCPVFGQPSPGLEKGILNYTWPLLLEPGIAIPAG